MEIYQPMWVDNSDYQHQQSQQLAVRRIHMGLNQAIRQLTKNNMFFYSTNMYLANIDITIFAG